MTEPVISQEPMVKAFIARYGRAFVKHDIREVQRKEEAKTPEYRAGAAETVRRQLLTCRSPKRRAKLEAKLIELEKE